MCTMHILRGKVGFLYRVIVKIQEGGCTWRNRTIHQFELYKGNLTTAGKIAPRFQYVRNGATSFPWERKMHHRNHSYGNRP